MVATAWGLTVMEGALWWPLVARRAVLFIWPSRVGSIEVPFDWMAANSEALLALPSGVAAALLVWASLPPRMRGPDRYLAYAEMAVGAVALTSVAVELGTGDRISFWIGGPGVIAVVLFVGVAGARAASDAWEMLSPRREARED